MVDDDVHIIFFFKKCYQIKPGACFSKSQEFFGPEKPAVKLQSPHCEKMIFWHVFSVQKTKRIAKFYNLYRTLMLQRGKENNWGTQNWPKTFHDFWETGHSIQWANVFEGNRGYASKANTEHWTCGTQCGTHTTQVLTVMVTICCCGTLLMIACGWVVTVTCCGWTWVVNCACCCCCCCGCCGCCAWGACCPCCCCCCCCCCIVTAWCWANWK